MSFSTDPLDLMREIEAAETARDACFSQLDALIESYAPRGLESERPLSQKNTAYKYKSAVVPQLVFTNPRWRVKTRLAGRPALVSKMLQAALNRWTKDVDLAAILTPTAYDYLDAMGVAFITRRPRPASPQPSGRLIYWPEVQRISPRHYFCDPLAFTREEVRYEGHDWMIDKDDLIREAENDPDGGWDLEAIEGLPAGNMADENDRRRYGMNTPDREEVRVYTLWIKDQEPEDDEEKASSEGVPPELLNGMIYTLAAAAGEAPAKEIRKPQPFFGPRWGPYATCHAAYVMDEALGISPLIAVRMQMAELDRHTEVTSNRAARQKRVYVLDTHDDDTAAKLTDAEDGEVINVRSFEGNLAPIEFEGLSADNVTYVQMMEADLDELLGISNSRLGTPTPDVTATAEAIADKSADIRIDGLKSEYHRFVQRIGETAGWYMFYDADFWMMLDASLAQEMGAPEGAEVNVEYRGGISGPDGSYDDYEMDIEPMSMERMSAGVAQRRMTELFDLYIRLLEVKMQFPDAPVHELANLLGDSMNLPDLARLFPPEGAMSAASAPVPRITAPRKSGGQSRGPMTSAGEARSRVSLAGNDSGRALSLGRK